MSIETVGGLVLLSLLGFVLSALFSGLETGLYTLNPVRLMVREARGDAAAVRLRREHRRPHRTLIVILIGTNAANYLTTFACAELLHAIALSDWALIALETAVVTPLIFVFAETLPKDMFRTHTDRWTYWFSPVLVVSRWLLTITLFLPCVYLVTKVIGRLSGAGDAETASRRQRVSQMIKEGVASGVLSVSQTTLADRAMAMRDRRVGSVMVPWSRVVSLPVDAEHTRREALLRRHGFTRLPVMSRDGRPAGVLSAVDAILNRQAPITDLLEEALTLPAGMRVPEALSTMRMRRRTMAIVLSSQTNRPVGLVTLKDLVEPLTGELAAW